MREIACVVVVRGMVTGVGFRYSALRKAGEFAGLKGYVRNADERTVECLLQGPESDVSAMIAWLRRGPPSAHVLDCKVTSVPADTNRPYFHVTY